MEAISYVKPKAHESANIEGRCGKSVCILLWSTMNMQIEKNQYIYKREKNPNQLRPNPYLLNTLW